MRKFLISVIGAFVALGAIAAGDNTPTSKSYVDAVVAQKQDKISANDGAPMVLTNTGVAGEYGTKGIYDANGAYATQTQNLIDAVTMNTAVQNAINSEFQCIEYNPNDPTDCWLLDIFGQTDQSILPDGYTALEYIESTGTQYIDTGYIPNQSSGVKTKVKFNSVANNWAGVFGAGSSAGVQSFEFYLWNGSAEFNYSEIGWGNQISVNDVLELDWNQNVVNYSINGVQQSQVLFPTKTFTAPYTMNMFALNRPAGRTLGLIGSIYYFKIYDNGILVRNFIPARRDSDGVLGMYDTVSNTFFTNAGTGEFIAGPVVNLYLPAGN